MPAKKRFAPAVALSSDPALSVALPAAAVAEAESEVLAAGLSRTLARRRDAGPVPAANSKASAAARLAKAGKAASPKPGRGRKPNIGPRPGHK